MSVGGATHDITSNTHTVSQQRKRSTTSNGISSLAKAEPLHTIPPKGSPRTSQSSAGSPAALHLSKVEPQTSSPRATPKTSDSSSSSPPADSPDGPGKYTSIDLVENDLPKLQRYDPATDQWMSDVVPCPTRRSGPGVAALNDNIYAVGGHGGHSGQSLDIVERYDVHRDEWTSVAPMGLSRGYHSVSVLDGCLYVVGGDMSGTDEALNLVESYVDLDDLMADVKAWIARKDQNFFAFGIRPTNQWEAVLDVDGE
ncbi:unnamed protein product [Haemonchus placei]|uniref:Kelch repeat-containing protein n=1 Tax=Haemonchus placei TaxID=6290 RepID=A0A0N4WYU4_HAEPC|nr:unnamed protein product [Haemonchus placei]